MDLEEELRITDKSDRFEETDLDLIIAKLSEVRKDFYTLNNIPLPEYPHGRNLLVDPKKGVKDVELASPKGYTVREQTYPVGMTVYLKGGNKQYAQEVMRLVNHGLSLEEALTVIDEKSARSTGTKPESAFVIEQSVIDNQTVELNWANAGDNVVFVISNGQIIYANESDPSSSERLGSREYPAYISSFKGSFPMGSQIVVIPSYALAKADRSQLLDLIQNSQGGQINLGQLDRFVNGKKSGKLVDEGVISIQAITAGQATSGDKLEKIPEKTQFSSEEIYNLKANLKHYLEYKFRDIDRDKKIVVEAAHVYAHQSFNFEHALGAQTGGQVIEALKDLGFSPQTELFIDNENAPRPFIKYQDSSLGKRADPANLNDVGAAYVDKISSLGFKPETVVWEADMNQKAQETMTHLLSQGKAVEDKGTWYLGEIGGIKLASKIDNQIKFTCQMLDAMKALGDLSKFDYAVTVLPEFYWAQQEAMKSILNALGTDSSRILNIEFTQDGFNVVEV